MTVTPDLHFKKVFIKKYEHLHIIYFTDLLFII